MSQKIRELIEERNRVTNAAREILDKAESEKRELTVEESGKWDELIGRSSKVKEAIDREARQQEAERALATAELRETASGKETASASNDPRATEEYRSAFMSFLTFGRDGLSGDEKRALQADQQTTGGFLAMPMQMANALIKAIDNVVMIRNKATKIPVPQAHSLGVPSLDSDPDDADWTAELGTGNEDNGMGFGRRELRPRPLAKRIKVSNKLLALVPGSESLVIDRLAYKFGIAEEKGFLLGNGVNQPLGLFVASASGISTGRDVSTGNDPTSPTFDGLQNAKYSVKQQYMRTGEWLFHRDAVKKLALLRDGEGQYLWQPSKREGEPDILLGRPVNMSEYVPNTFTSGLYVGLFGDLSYYWIADAMNIEVQRLVELYAATNQIGLIGRAEVDGMPVLEEAFARIKLG
ncbi:phage major capsid protein [Nitrosomonas oligotropha]|uniref:phage major capsid protein n=1 Tax=Nitrosomonas oligotropha TaxID=42354 RepID=UPI00136C2808|nr:phage major capsid protein [Nitrosomonas oligotropha]MXS81568.1 phage major capsid protein [Nitrosomonas oligotropha]